MKDTMAPGKSTFNKKLQHAPLQQNNESPTFGATMKKTCRVSCLNACCY